MLRRVHAAVAVLQGMRDFHVDPADTALFEAAMREQGHSDLRLVRFDTLDHLFMPTEAAGLASYADPSRQLAPDFLDELVRQLRRTLGVVEGTSAAPPTP